MSGSTIFNKTLKPGLAIIPAVRTFHREQEELQDDSFVRHAMASGPKSGTRPHRDLSSCARHELLAAACVEQQDFKN